MPFAEIIESPEVMSGAPKEIIERLPVPLGMSPEFRMRAGDGIDGEIDHPKTTRRQLLGHEHTTDLALSGFV